MGDAVTQDNQNGHKGSLEKLTESVGLRLLARLSWPLLVVVSTIGFNELAGMRDDVRGVVKQLATFEANVNAMDRRLTRLENINDRTGVPQWRRLPPFPKDQQEIENERQ